MWQSWFRPIFVLVFLWSLFQTPLSKAQEGEYSFLAPQTQVKTQFEMLVDAIDPTEASNPKGAKAPGFRGAQQLVIYTPAFGSSTQTNAFGVEAVVVDGRITQIQEANNSSIPTNGFVISGQGQSGLWIKRVAVLGALAEVDPQQKKLHLRITPDVYVSRVETLLNKASRAGHPEVLPQYHTALAEAQGCYRDLKTLASQGVTPTLVDQTETCLQQASQAYYLSVASFHDGFRGIWIRPVEKSPQEVEKAVQALKAAHVDQLFVETYFRGKTLYPSAVMEEYGLPKQHAEFQGWDPLAVWVDVAHRHGLKVHAWVQTFFAGNRHSELETYGPILQKYPQWRNVQRSAIAAATPVASSVEDGHYFVDPANPEVRQFLQKLILEVTQNYGVDGVNLDYIRYPASVPDSRVGFLATTWGYSAHARQAFKTMIEAEAKAEYDARIAELKAKAKTLSNGTKAAVALPKFEPPKADPAELLPTDPLWPRWVQWREEQVSSFVKTISAQIHEKKPSALVSAVVFPHILPKNPVKLQDWPRWVKEGWVQALTPIGLNPEPQGMYEDSLYFKRMVQGQVPVYAGVFGLYSRKTPTELVSQIDAVKKAGLPGVVLFERSRLDGTYTDALRQGPFRPANNVEVHQSQVD